jgi:hypothetical protein
MQILSINRNSTLDDCITEVHWKHSDPIILKKYPLSQAKELFPSAIAWHTVMTSGSEEDDPKLKWCLECWKAFKKTLPRLKEDEPNGSSPSLNDLNILSSSRNQVSNKKPKLKHASTELIVEMRHGEKLNKSRNLKALTDTGSSGCIILNEFVAGIHHKQSEGPQQWMTKGGLFKTNGICPSNFICPNFPRKKR